MRTLMENDNNTNETEMELYVVTKTPTSIPTKYPTKYPTPMPTKPTTRFSVSFSASSVGAVPTDEELIATVKNSNMASVTVEVIFKLTRKFVFPGVVAISDGRATTVVADVFDVPESEVVVVIGDRRLSSSEDLAEGRQLTQTTSTSLNETVATKDRTKAAEMSTRSPLPIADLFVQAYKDETGITVPAPAVGEATIEVQVNYVIVSNSATVVEPPTPAAFRAALIALKPETADTLGELLVDGQGETYAPTRAPTDLTPTPAPTPTGTTKKRASESAAFVGAPLAKAALALAALAALLGQ